MSEAVTSLLESLKIVFSGFKTAIGQTSNILASLKVIGSGFLSKLLAICLSLLYTFNGGYVGPETTDPIKNLDDSKCQLSFVALADSQVSNYILKRAPIFKAAGEDIGNAQSKIDALLIAGDIVENGLQCEYDLVYENIADCGAEYFLMATGNHDIRLRKYSQSVERFTDFTNSLNKDNDLKIDALHYSYKINGYTFIVMGSDRTEFEEAYFNDAQMKWLDETLSESSKSGKPTFVIIHQPLKLTHGLPDTWGSPIDSAGSVGKNSDELKEIMNKYKNVIMISGHLHTGLGQYTYEKIGNIDSINLPSTTIDNQDCTYTEKGVGYMVEAYSDKVVFRARNFAQGKYLPDYDITVPVK